MDYCFVHGYADFANATNEAAEARDERFAPVRGFVLCDYLTRLFESRGFVAERYTDAQIAAGVWFIFGIASEYLRYADWPCDVRATSRCIRAIGTMYRDLFDCVCGDHGSDSQSERIDAGVDCAVYMIWDMDSSLGAGLAGSNWAAGQIAEAELAVLDMALFCCRTSACQVSALHGIGEIIVPRREGQVTERLRQLIDRYLAERSPPEWLREYAALARGRGWCSSTAPLRLGAPRQPCVRSNSFMKETSALTPSAGKAL